MSKPVRFSVMAIAGIISATILISSIIAQEKEAAPEKPKAPEIPGITAEDTHPGGCVSCHRNIPEHKMDVRLSTYASTWAKGEISKELLAVANAAMPEGKKAKGKHPDISKKILEGAEIPGMCSKCHTSKSTIAPSLEEMAHLIHLSNKTEFTGDENHHLTHYQGTCTNCHKMNPETGKMNLKSGKEQK